MRGPISLMNPKVFLGSEYLWQVWCDIPRYHETGDRLQFAIPREPARLLDLEASKEDYGQLLPPWTQTVPATPLQQEAAVHQDQNLTPQEQSLSFYLHLAP